MFSGSNFNLVWITGASTGIGRALALRLARSGCVVLASARGKKKLGTLVDEAEALSGRIIAVPLDVTDADEVRATY